MTDIVNHIATPRQDWPQFEYEKMNAKLTLPEMKYWPLAKAEHEFYAEQRGCHLYEAVRLSSRLGIKSLLEMSGLVWPGKVQESPALGAYAGMVMAMPPHWRATFFRYCAEQGMTPDWALREWMLAAEHFFANLGFNFNWRPQGEREKVRA